MYKLPSFITHLLPSTLGKWLCRHMTLYKWNVNAPHVEEHIAHAMNSYSRTIHTVYSIIVLCQHTGRVSSCRSSLIFSSCLMPSAHLHNTHSFSLEWTLSHNSIVEPRCSSSGNVRGSHFKPAQTWWSLGFWNSRTTTGWLEKPNMLLSLEG